MPGKFPNMNDLSLEDTPVARLTEGLAIRELLDNHESVFEIRPEEESEEIEGSSAEGIFKVEDYHKYINLDMLSVENEDGNEDQSPFDKYRRKMQNLTEDGKILKFMVKPGSGVLVPKGCIVYIRYKAFLEYSEVPFDCTFMQNNCDVDYPQPFNLAKRNIIEGLYHGILSMKKGEKSEFLIHPDLAFGKQGVPPRIPAEATILMEVEVDRFVDCADIHANNDDLDEEERKKYCNIRKVARAHYTLANDHFERENYSTAANKYRQVINMMHNARAADEEEDKDRNHFLVKNYTNACVCFHKLKSYKKVCIMASDAVQVNPAEALKNSKLLYFWGYAKMMLGDYGEAKKHLLAAMKINPKNSHICEALKELDKKKTQDNERQKVMMQKMFNFQPKAKVTEYNEAEEQFRSSMKEQLEVFKNNTSQVSKQMREHFTREEERICLEMAKEMGFYSRVVDGDVRYILIEKPEQF